MCRSRNGNELPQAVSVIASSEVRSRRRPVASPRGVLAQALAQAEKCELDAKAPVTGWPLPLALAHCAQAIELSIAGFPRSRSRVFQSVLGRAIKRRFLRRGVMLHNRVAAIPGAPPLAPGVTRAEALARLRRGSPRSRLMTGRARRTSRTGRRPRPSTRRSTRCT